jgi:hypothetical protein
MSVLSILRRAMVMAVACASYACGGEARSASPRQAGAPAESTPVKAEFTVETTTVQLPIELPAQLSALRGNFFNTATSRLTRRENTGGVSCQN